MESLSDTSCLGGCARKTLMKELLQLTGKYRHSALTSPFKDSQNMQLKWAEKEPFDML